MNALDECWWKCRNKSCNHGAPVEEKHFIAMIFTTKTRPTHCGQPMDPRDGSPPEGFPNTLPDDAPLTLERLYDMILTLKASQGVIAMAVRNLDKRSAR